MEATVVLVLDLGADDALVKRMRVVAGEDKGALGVEKKIDAVVDVRDNNRIVELTRDFDDDVVALCIGEEVDAAVDAEGEGNDEDDVSDDVDVIELRVNF